MSDWTDGHIATFFPDGVDYVVMFNRDMLPLLHERGELKAFVGTKALRELLDKIDVKAQAGLCQMTHDGTRAFLKDIRQLIAAYAPEQAETEKK